jgi:hypothetical protein
MQTSSSSITRFVYRRFTSLIHKRPINYTIISSIAIWKWSFKTERSRNKSEKWICILPLCRSTCGRQFNLLKPYYKITCEKWICILPYYMVLTGLINWSNRKTDKFIKLVLISWIAYYRWICIKPYYTFYYSS